MEAALAQFHQQVQDLLLGAGNQLQALRDQIAAADQQMRNNDQAGYAQTIQNMRTMGIAGAMSESVMRGTQALLDIGGNSFDEVLIRIGPYGQPGNPASINEAISTLSQNLNRATQQARETLAASTNSIERLLRQNHELEMRNTDALRNTYEYMAATVQNFGGPGTTLDQTLSAIRDNANQIKNTAIS